VLALPEGYAQQQILDQTVHGRPLLLGMNPTLTPAATKALEHDNSLVVALLALSAAEHPVRPVVRPEDRVALQELGFRYVMVSWEAYDIPGGRRRQSPDQAREGVRRTLTAVLGAPAWDDARSSIWDLAGEGSPCAAAPPPPDAQRRGTIEPPARKPLSFSEADMFLHRPGQPAGVPGRHGRAGPAPTAPGARPPG